MDKTKILDITLTAWIAKLKSAPASERARKNVRPNFEDLFQQWKDLGASFDDVYENLLPKAIKAHYPVPSTAKNVYKQLKNNMGVTEKEFIESWQSNIETTAQEVFFEFFPPTPADHDPEPKVYGSMSATEYRAQRRYADQFATLKTDELVKQWREQQEYNLDVEDTLENILGDDDEAN